MRGEPTSLSNAMNSWLEEAETRVGFEDDEEGEGEGDDV